MAKPNETRLKFLEGRIVNAIGAASVVFSAFRNGVRWQSWTRATGGSITLPKATGKNPEFRLYLPQTLSGSLIIRAQTTVAADVIQGLANVQTSVFQSAAGNNTITLNGTTTGGVLGTFVILNDLFGGPAVAGQWVAEINALGSGTAATPFSTT